MTQRRIIVVLAALALLVVALPAAAQDLAQPIFSYDPSVCVDDNDGGELSARCRLMIEAYPQPANAERIQLDTSTLGFYSFWRVGPEATPLYGAPGGGIVGDIPAGYNFVTATDLTNSEYIQIQGGQWVRRSDAQYTVPSNFTGATINDGLEHEFAFVLDLSRIAVSRYPGGPRDNEYGRFLERYELVTIYATAFDDEGWRWYMIGPNEWVKQTFVSKVSKIERPEGVTGRWVAVDLYEQTMVAYEDDTPVFATLIASGLPPYDTNEGLFEVWARLPVDPMSGATGAPEAYALQSVPHVMYFDGGISLHGSYWHDYFGYRQSHGCVNLSVSDASWVYSWMTNGVEDRDINIKNYVYVHSSGEYGQPPGTEA
ncbi:MAG: L,D-transpeptidase [Chloroflexota bacterium]